MTELEVFKQSLDVSRLTLMVSLIVSTASIAFASLEMAFQRSHNIRSVRPFCELTAREEGGRVSIVIRNVGLGPLIVTSVSLSGPQAEEGESSGADDAARDIVAFETQPDGLVLPPLERAIVLSFPEAEREALAGRELRVLYRDIYDRKHEKAQALASVQGQDLVHSL
jgi:hypothetical protein